MPYHSTTLSFLRKGGLAVAIGVVAAGVGGGMGGCQSMTHAAIAPREDATASVPRAEAAPAATSRPSVKVTAADMYSWGPGAAAQQLEFYDEVESREIVAHDDVLHAALLFGRGASAPTFAQRIALAREQGWVDRSFSRPPHEAATVGEVSQIMARVMGLDGSSPQAGVASLSQAGVLPEGLTAHQGISGRQFLALLGRSYDWLQRDQAAAMHRPLPTRPPAVDLEAQAARADAAPAPAAQQPARPAAASPRAMGEPLPDLPNDPPPPAAPPTAAKDPPPAPKPAAEEPQQPKPAAPTPRPWVSGKPLGKKRN